nr:VENN motif pre-toxin domain-containing protein [Pantoea sp. JZ29]
MSEEQKQTISPLGTLAAGLAGCLAGGSASGAIAGVQAGKNALENNALGSADGYSLGDKHDEHEQEMGDRPIHLFTLKPGLEPKRDEQGRPLTYASGLVVPIKPDSLPAGYNPTSSGEVVGPKGGVYTSTGKLDSNGNTIYSNSGGYYVFDGKTKTSVESPNASNQIRNNYEQGKAFEDEIYNKYSRGLPESAREITIKTDNGTNVRVDIMTRDDNGGVSCIECKSSSTAPLTQNQKIGYPELEKMVVL